MSFIVADRAANGSRKAWQGFHELCSERRATASRMLRLVPTAARLGVVARAPADPEGPGRHRGTAAIRALPAAFDSDEALVAACVAKSPAAARVVWDRYAALVRGLLRRTLGRADVEDTLQETFLRLFRLIERLREPGKLRSFVVGVTMRVAREELRRRRVRRWLLLTVDGEAPDTEGPSVDVDATEALGRLERLLDRLDADSRIVFVLRFVENTPTSEIAEVLDCSLATAKRRVKRARERVESAAAEDPVLCQYVSERDPSEVSDE